MRLTRKRGETHLWETEGKAAPMDGNGCSTDTHTHPALAPASTPGRNLRDSVSSAGLRISSSQKREREPLLLTIGTTRAPSSRAQGRRRSGAISWNRVHASPAGARSPWRFEAGFWAVVDDALLPKDGEHVPDNGSGVAEQRQARDTRVPTPLERGYAAPAFSPSDLAMDQDRTAPECEFS
ncbi:hypothetical protein DFH09DRAFT_1320266 [Mycena vulgaris]|nr:hypothetical protein DFH09DRAFT_1320266 [Mycena vulgaris]